MPRVDPLLLGFAVATTLVIAPSALAAETAAQAAATPSPTVSLAGALPAMPDRDESLLIVLVAAIAGATLLWLGHVAGIVRLFRDDEPWPDRRR